MKEIVTFEVEGRQIGIEVADGPASLQPAGAADLLVAAKKPFEAAIDMLGALGSQFARSLAGRPISSAEIKLNLKVTAKGDLIVVGSSAEAVLEVKLVVTPS